jgi:hypothetical protein
VAFGLDELDVLASQAIDVGFKLPHQTLDLGEGAANLPEGMLLVALPNFNQEQGEIL